LSAARRSRCCSCCRCRGCCRRRCCAQCCACACRGRCADSRTCSNHSNPAHRSRCWRRVIVIAALTVGAIGITASLSQVRGLKLAGGSSHDVLGSKAPWCQDKLVDVDGAYEGLRRRDHCHEQDRCAHGALQSFACMWFEAWRRWQLAARRLPNPEGPSNYSRAKDQRLPVALVTKLQPGPGAPPRG
jgi:hypothetical protein